MHLHWPNGTCQTAHIIIHSIGILEPCERSRAVAILESNHRISPHHAGDSVFRESAHLLGDG